MVSRISIVRSINILPLYSPPLPSSPLLLSPPLLSPQLQVQFLFILGAHRAPSSDFPLHLCLTDQNISQRPAFLNTDPKLENLTYENDSIGRPHNLNITSHPLPKPPQCHYIGITYKSARINIFRRLGSNQGILCYQMFCVT